MATFPNPDFTNLSLLQPGTEAETADYSAGNYDFVKTPRYIKCSASGTLVVDLLGGGTQIELPVIAGVNPERVTRIYQAGSDAMTVVGIR